MLQDRINLTITEGVADVRLNRPGKMNALDQEMFEAINECGEILAETRGLCAVVLSGEGRAFCAGLDRDNFVRMAQGSDVFATGLERRTHGLANPFQNVALLWRNLPVPVIAAVHGVAFGGGLQIMLGADLRIVAPDTRLAVMEVRWGLVPDMAGMVLMPRIVRDDFIRELTFTGRQFDGEEAVRMGIATRLSTDPLAEALAIARNIAEYSPDAVRAAKRLLNLADKEEEAAVLLAESVEQQKLVGSRNQVEAVKARMEDRPAVFVDPDPLG